ncbi:MAG: ATP-binding protein [Planctomycetota bacterium]
MTVTEIESAIKTFTGVLDDLRTSHALLEARAERVEAELCRANEELGLKVAELAHVKQHLEAVLAAIPTGVVVYDAEGRVERANDAVLAILGVERTDLIGAEPTEVVCDDGEVRVLARRTSPIRPDGSATTGAVEVIEDQTDLVRARERIHRLDKTAALGTMAGGVAHEVRNPLQAVLGFADLLVRETETGSRPHTFARNIREGAMGIDAIVASMLGLADDRGLDVESISLETIARDSIDAALAEREHPDLWTVALIASEGEVRADRIKVRQALRNLLANAFDVLPDGGDVRVEIQRDDRGAKARVADGGPGVAPEDRHRLFDPFFTTRASGTGLGLALVQRVAELHGGRLDLEPAPSELGGAAFTLTIPDQDA